MFLHLIYRIRKNTDTNSDTATFVSGEPGLELPTERSSQPSEAVTRKLTLTTILERIGLDADSEQFPFPCIFFWDWAGSSEDESINSSDGAAAVTKRVKMGIDTTAHPRLSPILELETLILGATLHSRPSVSTSSSEMAERAIELNLHISVHPNLMSSHVLSMFAHQVRALLEAVLRDPEDGCSVEFICQALSVPLQSNQESASNGSAGGTFFLLWL